MKIAYSPEALNKILEYLTAQPYREVVGLVQLIHSGEEILEPEVEVDNEDE